MTSIKRRSKFFIISMRMANFTKNTILGIIIAISLASTRVSSDAPVYPILSGLDYVGRLHLLAQTQSDPAYTKASLSMIEQIASNLVNFRKNKKHLETVRNITNQLLNGTAHDQCMSHFYTGYTFAFNYLDSITFLEISHKEAMRRLINLVSGQENLPKLTILALTRSAASKHTALANESLSLVDLDLSDVPDQSLGLIDESERVNSKCFAEGALQAFELNFERFKRDEQPVVQTAVKVMIEELLGKKEVESREVACVSESEDELEQIFDRFVQLEVSLYRVQKQVRRVEGLEQKSKKKFMRSWRKEYLQFQENLRELKSFIFSDLTSRNTEWELRATEALQSIESINTSRRLRIERKFSSLKDQFDAELGRTVFIRLVRKSEKLFSIYQEQIMKIVREYHQIFVEGRRSLHLDYVEALDHQAMRLNEMFWKSVSFDFREIGEQECDDDYLDYLMNARKDAAKALRKQLNDKEQWLIPDKTQSFQLTIQGFLEKKKDIRKLLVSVWEEFEIELETLWDVSKEPIDDFFTCYDPVREWLNELYSEFLALEIQPQMFIEDLLKRAPKYIDQKFLRKEIRSKYGQLIDIIRNFKADVNEAVWKELRGSMDHIHGSLEDWGLLVAEMKNQWGSRTTRMRDMLLAKGLLLEEVQNAIRKHDEWLEDVEHGDLQLRELEFRAFYGVHQAIRRKVRGKYIKLAKDINLRLWATIFEFEKSREDFSVLVERFVKGLDSMQTQIKLDGLKRELLGVDAQIRDTREEISDKHIEYWTQALIDNEQFWHKLGEDVDEGNQEPEPSVDQLVCLEGAVSSRAVRPVDLESVYQEFVSNELEQESVLSVIRKTVPEEVNGDAKDKLERKFAAKFGQIVEMLRAWKAEQYEEVLSVYLDREVRFEHFSVRYGEMMEKYSNLWRSTEADFKKQWLQVNSSTVSIDQLTRLLEYQLTKWDLRYQENDKFVSLLMRKLWIFRARLKQTFLDYSLKINRVLYDLLTRQLRQARDWSSPDETLKMIWMGLVTQIRVEFAEIRSDLREELDGIYKEIDVNFENKLELIDQSSDAEFRERLTELEKALSQLRPEEEEPETLPEMVCADRTMDHLKWPLEKTLETMISDEIRIEKLTQFVHRLRLAPALDVKSQIERVHAEWVELNREYKSQLVDKVTRAVVESDSQVVGLLEAWDRLVEESIMNWEKRSRAQIEEHVLEENSTTLISEIKTRTEDYIRAALELDEQLKLFYFEGYLQRIGDAELELHNSGMKISKTINLQYLEDWRDMALMLSQSPSVSQEKFVDFIEGMVRNIESWLEQDSPVLESGVLEESIATEITGILKNITVIADDHEKLWKLLNTKFHLTGPEGSLEEFWDEQGNCDIFKIMKMPSPSEPVS